MRAFPEPLARVHHVHVHSATKFILVDRESVDGGALPGSPINPTTGPCTCPLWPIAGGHHSTGQRRQAQVVARHAGDL